MKIVLIGQALFAKDCLESLLQQGEDVVGVITIPDDSKGKPYPVKNLAREKNIPVCQPPGKSPNRLKDRSVIAMVKDLKPDLFVLAFVSDIMPYEVIKMSTYGGINYHPSLLPKYRGGSAINWAIINGEKETGVTVHYIDEGIDTGDIVLQESVVIDPKDTLGSVYFNKLYPLGVQLITQAVKLIREGNAPRILQNESQASYQPMIMEEDVKIDWNQTSETICNLIRGSNPSPGAYSMFRDEKIKIWDGELSKDYPEASAGEVVEVMAGKGFTVASGNGSLLIKKLQRLNETKISSLEFDEEVNLKPGEQWR